MSVYSLDLRFSVPEDDVSFIVRAVTAALSELPVSVGELSEVMPIEVVIESLRAAGFDE